MPEYTATVWREHSHTPTEKLAALDNLDSMAETAVDYIDSITHSERHYNKTECDSKFFTAANDGAGSGCICEKLDGMTAQQIINAYVPTGVIVAWSGSIANIPSGFALCNGLNGTPDLRDRFVLGAGSVHSKGSSGGSNTATTSATVTIAGHALTRGEVPLHAHGYPDRYESTVGDVELYPSGGGAAWVGAPVDHPTHTEDTGSGAAHSHGATYTGQSDQEKMPAYYALAFIMRL